ncbi:DUF6519 domain-containing protein [Bradyrhizobium sp. cf659]|uniref:DUF6519 domain-containing protein n=1 Tax=Bradyrhizobium sp. cf659 TaxID=1761771 RepID=UPI0008EC1D15|nr:DUF6519 domain-containing protein [Bradyrhizobium sp. cf659]SFH98553.1 hypothetical protein SAMN04487925_1011407 [Bradyrhizobium sp. cf659]
MTGDFTRDSFGPEKGFTRVLMQQGRPQLDADLNEQVAIFWHYWRTMLTDLVGPYAGPYDRCGFGVVTREVMANAVSAHEREELQALFKDPGEFLLSPGRYYVDGILCEIKHYLAYSAHLEHDESLLAPKRNVPYLIYLDVWERPVTSIEDETIGEPALNGIDTSLRARVTWRVRIAELDKSIYGSGDCNKVKEHWSRITHAWQPEHRGRLKVGVSETAESAERDHRHQEAGYRGPHNQLYRVEIHHGGVAGGGASGATFKVSRENASVIFRIAAIEDSIVTLDTSGRDRRFGLRTGDWVEIDDAAGYGKAPGRLWQIQKVDASRRQITLDGTPRHGNLSHRPHLMRRWDHKAGDAKRGGLELRDGAVVLKEGEGNNNWLSLENGLRIQFHKSNPANIYRPGDYWLIPARVATGAMWPQEHGRPRALSPHGIEHHYAPLAIVSFGSAGVLETQGDCRLKFNVPVAF